MNDLHYCVLPRQVAKDRGIKRYFTGIACKHGHLCDRLVSSLSCSECGRIKSRKQYWNDPSSRNEKSRQWKNDNSGRVAELRRKRYERNRKDEIEYAKQHRDNNADYYTNYGKNYRKNNREKCLARLREWQKNNPDHSRLWRELNRDKHNAKEARRRAAKLQRTLSHEEELTQFVMQEAAKHASDMEDAFGMQFHVDHMIPMQGESVSGLHVWYNLQVIPASLNIIKGNRMMYTEPYKWLDDAT